MTAPVTVANPGYPGAYGNTYGAEVNQSMSASATVTLPLGMFTVQLGAHDAVLFNVGTATTITLAAAGVVAPVIQSDGQNVQIVNNGGGADTTHYWQILNT